MLGFRDIGEQSSRDDIDDIVSELSSAAPETPIVTSDRRRFSHLRHSVITNESAYEEHGTDLAKLRIHLGSQAVLKKITLTPVVTYGGWYDLGPLPQSAEEQERLSYRITYLAEMEAEHVTYALEHMTPSSDEIFAARVALNAARARWGQPPA